MKNILLSSERFILKWTIIAFAVTILLSLLICKNDVNFIYGVTAGTILSSIKFLLSSFNIRSALKDNTKVNVIKISIINFLSMIVIFVAVFIFFRSLNNINLQIVSGFLLGISYITLIIITAGFLQSKYIIRNKL